MDRFFESTDLNSIWNKIRHKPIFNFTFKICQFKQGISPVSSNHFLTQFWNHLWRHLFINASINPPTICQKVPFKLSYFKRPFSSFYCLHFHVMKKCPLSLPLQRLKFGLFYLTMLNIKKLHRWFHFLLLPDTHTVRVAIRSLFKGDYHKWNDMSIQNFFCYSKFLIVHFE